MVILGAPATPHPWHPHHQGLSKFFSIFNSSPSFPHKFYSVHAQCPSSHPHHRGLIVVLVISHHRGLSTFTIFSSQFLVFTIKVCQNWISESSRPYPYTHLFNAPILRVPLLEHPFVQFSVENSIFVTRFSLIYRIHPFMPTNILLTPSSQQNVWRAERARHLGENLQTFSVGSFSNQRHPQLNRCEALPRRNRTWKMKTQLQTSL